ncbi:hypothetical protein [Erwinia sp. V71]|uniref:hypothetical protein n=1 Tax=Erwinia sp. V71 TaxID=3369424 RepID=UPI003F639F40
MTSFTVRVELHQATYDDMAQLHDMLIAQGYSNIITDPLGKRFYLPLKEYVLESDDTTAGQVLQQVRRMAESVRPQPKVLVTEAASCHWFLPVV